MQAKILKSIYFSLSFVISGIDAFSQLEKTFQFQGQEFQYQTVFAETFDDNSNAWTILEYKERGDKILFIEKGEYHFSYLSYYMSGQTGSVQFKIPNIMEIDQASNYEISFRFKLTGSAPDRNTQITFCWNESETSASNGYCFEFGFESLKLKEKNSPNGELDKSEWGFYHTIYDQWQNVKLKKLGKKYTLHVGDLLEMTVKSLPVFANSGNLSISSNVDVAFDDFKINKIILVKEELPQVEIALEEEIQNDETEITEETSSDISTSTLESEVANRSGGHSRDVNVQAIVDPNKGGNGSHTGINYALIIGNNDYQDAGLAKLDQPINDATELYNVLINKYTFYPENVVFLKNATRKDMIRQLDIYSDQLTDNDNLLIFYAGHGLWDERKEQGFWFPVDAEKNITADWLRNSTIQGYIECIESKHTLLIADACFGGGIFKTRAAFSDASKSVTNLYKYRSRKAMTSGMLNEVPDKSVFMQNLVMRLNDNEEKYLSSMDLFMQFRESVMNNSFNAPQYGTIHNTGDLGGDFIFVLKIEE